MSSMLRRQSREIRSQNFEEIIEDLPEDLSLANDAFGNDSISCLLIPADQLAQQMTLLDCDAFKSIQKHELKDGAWLKDEKETLAPHIVLLRKRFNKVSFWVIQELLNADGQKNRFEKLEHFVKLAKKLHQYNNIHGLLAVVSGLQSAPVYRLQKTWALLKDKYSEQLDRLEEFLSVDENYKNIREHLETTKTPCIPYIGLYLTDFMHLSEKRKRTTDREKVDSEIEALYDKLAKFQTSSYAFGVDGYVRRYVQNLGDACGEDASSIARIAREQYARSLFIEPKGEADEDEAPQWDEYVQDTPTPYIQRFQNLIRNGGSLPFRGRAPKNGHRRVRSMGATFNTVQIVKDESLLNDEDNDDGVDAYVKSTSPHVDGEDVADNHVHPSQNSSPQRKWYHLRVRSTNNPPLSKLTFDKGKQNHRYSTSDFSSMRVKEEFGDNAINHNDDRKGTLPILNRSGSLSNLGALGVGDFMSTHDDIGINFSKDDLGRPPKLKSAVFSESFPPSPKKLSISSSRKNSSTKLEVPMVTVESLASTPRASMQHSHTDDNNESMLQTNSPRNSLVEKDMFSDFHVGHFEHKEAYVAADEYSPDEDGDVMNASFEYLERQAELEHCKRNIMVDVSDDPFGDVFRSQPSSIHLIETSSSSSSITLSTMRLEHQRGTTNSHTSTEDQWISRKDSKGVDIMNAVVDPDFHDESDDDDDDDDYDDDGSNEDDKKDSNDNVDSEDENSTKRAMVASTSKTGAKSFIKAEQGSSGRSKAQQRKRK
eukprot:m.74977 g.74977  ORF g.74977 m.74977 type:complete len:766 (-) comp8465_c7_seq1:135-2432(-)